MIQAQKVIIDTDPGVDDAMAVIYACLEPKIELVGLTSIFGNVTIDIATRNALVLVELAGREIPVARGANKPIVQESREVAWEVHGREGFGDLPARIPSGSAIDESAHEFICRMINEAPGEIILCPVGPLTNLALALEHDPSIASKVKSVTVMGGSVEEGGNVTPFAEANIWQDPHAAEVVFSADWPVELIGLDVTHRVICSPEDFAQLRQPAPRLGGFLNDAAQFYFGFHERENGFRGCHMHDPTAVISIVEPGLFSFDEIPLDVILEGNNVGQTVVSRNANKPSIHVAMGIGSDAVREKFLETIKTGF